MENLQEPMSTENNQPIENEQTVENTQLEENNQHEEQQPEVTNDTQVEENSQTSEELPVEEMQTVELLLNEESSPSQNTEEANSESELEISELVEEQKEETCPEPEVKETECDVQPETVEEIIPEQPEQIEIVSENEPLPTEEKTEDTKSEPELEVSELVEEQKEENCPEPEVKETECEVQPETVGETVHEESIEESEPEEPEIADDFFDHLNRQEAVETLEEIVGENNVTKIKKQMSLLKIRFLLLNKEEKEQRLQLFLANGGNKEDYDTSPDELEERYNKVFERYRANKAKYVEELEQTKVSNLEKKQALLDELKQLIESSADSLKQIYDRFKEIQVTWKEIGAVPQANVTELWQNYHFYVEKFFDKVKINRELRDLDLKKNLEKKLELCEKTEALMLETSIVRSFKLLQQYHKEWKESGPVEDDKKEELWNRFKTASDKINQQRRDYYELLDNQQEENYKAKLALCDRIEEFSNTEITSIKLMNERSDEVAELFKTWKTLGAAPKEVHDEVWNRFRQAMDTFFANKKQYLSNIKEEQVNNYNLKVNLCIQAEAISERKDWKKATTEILALQQEWKSIGTVSHKQADLLWKRFRKACDSFFEAKNGYFGDVHKHEAENLQKKEDLIIRVNEYVFVETRDENFEALKNFQREWTSIGYTAISEKERLWDAFRTAIDKRFEELKATAFEVNKARYTERINNLIGQDSKSNDALQKEQRFLQNKIKQLTDDVNLWENNLGFFANSKNSEELKEQFGKKIEQAKQEIETLQAKLVILRDSKDNSRKEKRKE